MTLVDEATRFPLAEPLKNIDTETLADALWKMMCDKGIPNEMLSDNGSLFTSGMMEEVMRLLSVKHLTTPYHAMCNGLCEKWNGTPKQMLKRMITEQAKEWDRFISPLLFAYREVPTTSLAGFSPFELLYGRTVRGPMSILREVWTKEDIDEEVQDTYEYVLNLRKRLEETCDLASKGLGQAKEKQKYYFDRKARLRKLETGDEVLILLPTDNNKLLMKWKGPFKVMKQVGLYNYVIEIGNHKKVSMLTC